MTSLCKIAVLLLALLNLLSPFVKFELSYLIFAAALTVLITGLPLMGPGFRNITAGFGIIGSILLVYTAQPFSVWVTALNSMTNVISILIVMSIFSIPVEAGKYNLAVQYWLSKSIKSESALFLLTTVITHFLASFMLFGTIPVIVSLLGNMLKQSVTNYERFISMAASRGYALVTLWAPGAINLFLVIQATGVKWLDIFVPGIILSIIGIITSYFLEKKKNLSLDLQPGNKTQIQVQLDEQSARTKAWTIVLAVLSLVALTVVFEKLNFGSSSSSRVMLAGASVILVWTAIVAGQPGFKLSVVNFWHGGLLKSIDLAPLFLSMGVFSKAVESSGLLGVVQFYIQDLANSIGMFAIAIVPLVLILTAIIGIHPFISIVLVGQILASLHLPLAPITIALCLALGGVISYMVSPFAGIVLTLAKYINCKTTDVALRWNWRYCLLYYLEGILFINFWGWYFGK